jgi:hypothetical protein
MNEQKEVIKKRKKTGGRQKGTPNKKAAIIRGFCDYLVNYGLDKFKIEFDKLEGEEYVSAFLKLAKIVTDDNTSIIANKGLIEIFNQNIKQNGTSK